MWIGMKRAVLLCLILGLLIGLWCVKAQAQGGSEDWTEPLNLSGTQQASDSPLIISDSGGTVHVFWSEDVKGELLWEKRAPLLSGTAIFYTRWDGTDWTAPVDILTSPKGNVIQPDGAVVDSEDRLYLTFANYCSWALSSDAGSSPAWASPVAFAPAVHDSKITIDRAGHLHIVYAQWYPDGIYHTSSTDGGRTWSDSVRISSRFVEEATRHEHVALALDGRGRLHVGWIQRSGEAFDDTIVWYAQSTDGGQTWTKPLKLAETGELDRYVNSWIRVIARGENEIHLVWVGGQVDRLHQWSSDGGQTWTGPFHILGDLYGDAGGDGFAIDGAGTLHVVTQLRYPQALYHAYWDGAAWSHPTPIYLIDLDAPRSFELTSSGLFSGYIHVHHPRLVVSEGNKLSIVMQDQPRGEIWYMAGRSPAPHVPPTFWSRPTTIFHADSTRQAVTSPAAIADRAGNVHLFWSHGLDQGTSQARSVISYMRWDRTSWSWSEPTNILKSPEGSSAMRPRVALGPDDVLHVMWLALRGVVLGDDIYYSYALASDAGSPDAWSQPALFPESSMLFGFQIPHDILADQAGNLHVAYARYADGYYNFYYTRSRDKGDTWARPVCISDVRKGMGVGAAALAIDGNGRLHVAWVQILTEDTLSRSVWYSRSSDGGQTWKRPLQITDVGAYSEPNIAVTGKETIHLMWNGTADEFGRYHQWSADGGESWTAAVRILETAGWAGQPQMVVDGAGTLHLVTSSGVTHPMVYTFWDGATWAEPVEFARGSGGEMPAMVLREGNKLGVAWPAGQMGGRWDEIRWATRRINAPYVSPRPLATPAPVPTTTLASAPVSTTSPASAPVSEPTPTARWQGGSRSSSAGDLPPAVDSDRNSAWYPLLVGILPAALLVVVVILSWTVRSRRQW